MQIEDNIANLITKKLAGELTFNEQLVLEEWLKAKDEHLAYYQSINSIWEEAKPDYPELDQDEEQIWLKLEDKLDQVDNSAVDADPIPLQKAAGTSSKFGFPVIRVAAAVVFLAIVVATLMQVYNYPNVVVDFAPNHANLIILPKPLAAIRLSSDSNNVFILPDNTKVWLNSHSFLSYDQSFGEVERKVILDGEGYFEVAHNAKIPFFIEANGSETKVLGTKFNLKAYQDSPLAVTVVSGKVAFSSVHEREEQVLLNKGEKATLYVHERRLVKQKWEDRHTLDWKHLLVYQRELSQPINYLKNSANWKKSIINQTEIKGQLSNLASLATYNNIKLKITYRRKNKIKSNVFTVYKSLTPGQTISYKYRLADWFGKTEDLKIEVLDASVTRNQ